MDRRSFLLGTGTLAISHLLTGCAGKEQIELKVQLLQGSIPGQLVNQFRKGLQKQQQVKFTPIGQIEQLFKQLKIWQQQQQGKEKTDWTSYIPFISGQKHPLADLTTVGDYWLSAAISQKLIEPLDTTKIKQWSSLDSKWQELVKRDEQGNPDPQGKIWGVPYRWGSTAIVYNRDKFQALGWQPTDWSDLWRSELRSQISLLNQPREVIGLVLKKLGHSYNTTNLDQISALETELKSLNQQVKFYDSTKYLEPLIIGDTWLAVGWSNDIIPVLGRNPQLSAFVPKSGTAMWADVWIRPQGGKNSDLVYQWIDFCLQEQTANTIKLLTKVNSPIATNVNVKEFQPPVQNLLFPSPEIVAKSEFLLPLSPQINQQYHDLFTKIQQST
ncbi:extracellular solute-binding protein, family 1 [Richelia sinica FACHB-800]|uniref:Extracellular solute-binding protein, family 1 n=1 Tax=Richelia sinica FACHB-800 TaxID=1357546 RepID=A0A975Y5W6_9NOST|nr:extracellular solute-binding protein [Richelia sinica]MBD2663459.1 extracellular solute-binding protein [Richelia sinica FACHB-800]QXE24644.1 extracellular solute-binding protein, family 1 [Richelia sinica FACHB-800]